ncbi:MAG: hypothetical protein LBI35_07235 [Burkholderiales bacterium]|jgi:hypothetical protein|nr:hypothetical protein [Burkholderiales bacterium]
MPMLSRKVLLTAAIETGGYGVMPTFAGANAILIAEPKLTSQSTERAERKVVRRYFGASGEVYAANHMELEFDVELAGAGTPGDVPGFGVLLRSCSFAEIVTPGVGVLYKLVTDDPESIALGYNTDGVQHNGRGGRGTVSFDLQAKNIGMMKFKHTALYVPPHDAAMLQPDYSGFRAPLAANTTNTPVLLLDGRPLVSSGISIDIANDVIFQANIGSERVMITGRKVTGQLTFEKNRISEKDWYDLALSGKALPLKLTHGTTPGNRITFEAPCVKLGQLEETDQDGIAMLQAALTFEQTPDGGDDELTIEVH